jgi:peptidoglycan/xylan/chitin deacetylase (PgdA/CDA1 family)
MRRIVAEGHELGSHAAQHKYLPYTNSTEVALLLDWAVANFSQVTGVRSVPVRMRQHASRRRAAGAAGTAAAAESA